MLPIFKLQRRIPPPPTPAATGGLQGTLLPLSCPVVPWSSVLEQVLLFSGEKTEVWRG